jgi:hypothetical protein
MVLYAHASGTPSPPALERRRAKARLRANAPLAESAPADSLELPVFDSRIMGAPHSTDALINCSYGGIVSICQREPAPQPRLRCLLLSFAKLGNTSMLHIPRWLVNSARPDLPLSVGGPAGDPASRSSLQLTDVSVTLISIIAILTFVSRVTVRVLTATTLKGG